MNKKMKKTLMALVLTMGVSASIGKVALASSSDPGDPPRPVAPLETSYIYEGVSLMSVSDPGDPPRP